ncbi:MAG TPA: type II secretion system protein [Anoxybacillus sp.]|jgi:type IV pilus assembly protein PilA|nr:type II secretion system protein [Anoxybacillus sp.]
MLKRLIKNEKGLTLIELLAVVVILGIISAIAVPSIGGLIDNSKKDAHVANAQQMINAAKIYVAGNAKKLSSGDNDLLLKDMYKEGLLDPMKDPDTGVVNRLDSNGNPETGNGYNLSSSKVVITKQGNNFTYKVLLIGHEKKVARANDTPVPEEDLERGVVK